MYIMLRNYANIDILIETKNKHLARFINNTVNYAMFTSKRTYIFEPYASAVPKKCFWLTGKLIARNENK